MGYLQMTRNVESIFGAVVTAPHQIPYTYTATGGETFISLPFYPVTGFITINSGVQVPVDNYVIDGNTVNLGRALEAGDVVYCLFDKILSPEDYQNGIRIYKFQAVGNETTFTPDFTTYGVQSLYAKTGAGLTGYKVIYDKVSQRSYALPSNLPAGATITSMTDGILVHNTGTVDLGALAALRGEFVTLVENFTTGFTIKVRNEIVSDGTILYKWNGSLPKSVSAGGTPKTTGGITSSAWERVGVTGLKQDLLDPAFGSKILATKEDLIGAIVRTQLEKNSDEISAKDFGAIGDGTVHPLSEIFSTLAAAQMVYPFVTSLTQTQDYAGIQAAINTNRSVLVPSGEYFCNATFEMNANSSLRGESNKIINRPSTFISVIGNIPCFHYGAQFNTVNLKGFYIYYDGGRPTVASGNDGKIAILMDGGDTSPGVMNIENVDIDGAWWGIYDNSGNYLTKYTHVWVRRSAHGFYKANGTTIQWDTCYVMDAEQAWYVVNSLSPQLLNCAADQLVIDASKNTYDGAGLYFTGCKSLTLIGFDGESNVIKNLNAVTGSYLRMNDTYATIMGFASHGNSMQTSGAGIVNFIQASGFSKVNIIGSVDTFLDGQTITYTGSGYPITLHATETAKIITQGSRWKAPTGGTPVISTVSTGNVVYVDCDVTGIVSGGYQESRDSNGLKIPGIYTAKGTQAVAANTATTLFTLPNTQGAYLISVWASGSGTNYSSTQLAMYDGAVYLAALKAASFITFAASGRDIQITSQGATTFNWSYVKVG